MMEISNVSFFINKEPIWFTAISNNDINLWDFWLKKNPNVNTKDNSGQTPLHWACFLKRKEMVFDLLNLGANPWIIDNEGYAAFFLAMVHEKSSYWNISEWPFLFPNNFEIRKNNAQLFYHCTNYIFKLAKNKKYHHLHIFLNLIPLYKLPTFVTFKNNTVNNIPWIHIAYAWKDKKLAQIFFNWGVSANATDNYGYTVLEMAIVEENTEWIDFLLINKAEFNSSKKCDDYELICRTNSNNAFNIYSIMEKQNLNKEKILQGFNKIENEKNKINFVKRCFYG